MLRSSTERHGSNGAFGADVAVLKPTPYSSPKVCQHEEEHVPH